MDRFLEAAASFFGRKHGSKKGTDRDKPRLKLNSSDQVSFTVEKTQNKKEGKPCQDNFAVEKAQNKKEVKPGQDNFAVEKTQNKKEGKPGQDNFAVEKSQNKKEGKPGQDNFAVEKSQNKKEGKPGQDNFAVEKSQNKKEGKPGQENFAVEKSQNKKEGKPGQNNFVVEKTQNEKEGKLKDKGKLFVGGLSHATTAKELSVYFSKFGDVINSVVVKCPKTGKSRGFGFVTFLNPGDAEKALQTEDHILNGKAIECRRFDSKDNSKETKARSSNEARVFLGGLPADVTKEELQQFFSRYGKVMDICVPVDKDTKQGKGFAFISFQNEDVAEKCISERFVYLKERRVFINKADIRDARPHSEGGVSTASDQDSCCPEDSASLADDDTQSSSSGQLNFELEQHPEVQELFQNYFKEKLTYYSGVSEKEIENTKHQFQNNEIEELENFLRGISVNSTDQVLDSESLDSDTTDDSYEEDSCKDPVSLLSPQGGCCECTSKSSVGKSTSKATLPFEEDGPDLKLSTREFIEGSLHKSSGPMNFKTSTGNLKCYVCEWISPEPSFETFLAHLSSAAHKMKLAERFSESQTQGVKVESKVHLNSEKQKNSQSEEKLYPKVTGILLDDSQRQSNSQNTQKCGNLQQAHQNVKQLPEQPLPHHLVKKEVQKVKEVKKQKRKRKKKEQTQEQNVLNSVQKSKATTVPNSKNENQTFQKEEQNSQEKTKDKKNTPNLKVYALAKGMACIQPLSENRLKCEMCNKIIPESSDFEVLMRNVSQHLQSKTHLQKLLETEDKLKNTISKNVGQGETSSLSNKNPVEESVEGKKILTKNKKTKEPTQKNLAEGAASSTVAEKAVLESKKPEPKDMGVNSAPKQKKAKTEDSSVKILCLQCNFSNSTFEKFERHLESERHSKTSTSNGPLKVRNAEYTECNSCNAVLFGSLYEINVHFSKCLKKKG